MGVVWPPALKYDPMIHASVLGGSTYIGITPLAWTIYPLWVWYTSQNITPVGGTFELLCRPPEDAGVIPLPISALLPTIHAPSHTNTLPWPPIYLCSCPGNNHWSPHLYLSHRKSSWPTGKKFPETTNILLVGSRKHPQDGTLTMSLSRWFLMCEKNPPDTTLLE